MALAICDVKIDTTGRELLQHGSSSFPIACYYDNLRENEVPWHWHEELEAAIITEGSAKVFTGNQKYILRSGEGFFINSGILHGMWDLDSSGCRFHSMVFHPRLIGGSLDSIFHQGYLHPLTQNQSLPSLSLSPRIPWHNEALKAIEKAWQACVNEPSGYEFKVRNELSDFVYLLCSNFANIKQTIDRKTQRNDQRIKQMLQYIQDNYKEDLSSHKIALASSISESECLRCFKNTIGTTPIQYVRQYRIQKACELLMDLSISITDIASACGFQDLSYFTKTFKEIKGCTPSQYRDKKKTNDG